MQGVQVVWHAGLMQGAQACYTYGVQRLCWRYRRQVEECMLTARQTCRSVGPPRPALNLNVFHVADPACVLPPGRAR